MKKYFAVAVWLLFFASPCSARDFLVRFVEENYREARAEFSNDPVIYHTLQISSNAGPKLLIVKGDDQHHRKWLRYSIAKDKELILTIPDEEMEAFMVSSVFEIDARRIHPYNPARWAGMDEKPVSGLHQMEGDNHILIVDADEKRVRLVQSVVEKMQYRSMAFNEGASAMKLFEANPRKFKMVILHLDHIGMPADRFIEKIVQFNPSMPILLDIGHRNEAGARKIVSQLSGYGSIHVRTAVLRDLQKTVENLIKKDA